MIVLLVALLLIIKPIICGFIAPGREFRQAEGTFLVSKKTTYIPMGRHLMLDCQAMKEVEDNGYSTLKVVWIWRGFKGKGRIEKQNNVRQKRMYEVNGQLIIYAVQSENEGWYDCHVYANDTREWVSRHYLNVQDCRLVGNATLSLNPRNPCKYGQCTIRNYFTPVNYSYLHCKCIRQFTGEFCHRMIPYLIFYEMIYYIPFAFHMFSIGFLFVYGCYLLPLQRKDRQTILSKVIPQRNQMKSKTLQPSGSKNRLNKY